MLVELGSFQAKRETEAKSGACPSLHVEWPDCVPDLSWTWIGQGQEEEGGTPRTSFLSL